MPALFFGVLAVPLFFSYVFSYEKNVVWMAGGLVSLLCCATLLLNQYRRVRLRHRACVLAALALLAAFQLLRLLSFYFQGTGFNNAFFYHLELNNALAAWRAYVPLLLGCVAYLVLLALLLRRVGMRRSEGAPLSVALVIPLLAGGLALDPDLRSFVRYEVELGRNLAQEDRPLPRAEALAAQHLDPAVLEQLPIAASPGKNLVLLYLESLEATYFDKERFGDLLPRLGAWQERARRFPNMVQTDGTGFTMAGIVASQCGTSMLFEAIPNGNDVLNQGVLNRVACLGDILSEAGYRQTFMGGAPLSFAGKGRFLEMHQYDRVLGRRVLSARLSDPDYLTGWGLYDDSLFEQAWQEFERLAARGEPFNLTLLTLDTHAPTGEPSASCAPFPESNNSMLNAVYCSDQLVSAFLDRLRQHPAWQNTVVALVSDHYAMRNAAQSYYPDYRRRRLLFSLLNAGEPGEVSRMGTLMDIAPTLLDALEVQHNQAFLAGTSLLRDAPELNRATLDAQARNRLMRRVNTRLFTSRGKSVCESSAMLRLGTNSVRVGGRRVYLSEGGTQLPPDAVGSTHALLVLLDGAGNAQSASVLPADELPAVLYRNRDREFLLAASAAALPEYLRERLQLQPDAGLQILLGTLMGTVLPLDAQQVEDELVVASPACGRLLNTVSNSLTEANSQRFVVEYCSAAPPSHNHLDTNAGNLYLEKVFYQNVWFEADLQQDDDGYFTPVRYEQLDPPEDEVCYAYISDNELVIPDLLVDDARQNLSLTRLPGEELRFSLEAGQGGG
ncbi:MAG TPA: sulfatase-like hydrolase/transferase [Hyphomicrobiales bacterium]|nr:sulfatase-like hydrolase/transferase [Hyphomicrobiales bacterium]